MARGQQKIQAQKRASDKKAKAGKKNAAGEHAKNAQKAFAIRIHSVSNTSSSTLFFEDGSDWGDLHHQRLSLRWAVGGAGSVAILKIQKPYNLICSDSMPLIDTNDQCTNIQGALGCKAWQASIAPGIEAMIY
eukprot:gene4526-6740_t